MKRLTLGLAVLAMLAFSVPSTAAVSRLIVFGDSLVDSGNAQIGAIGLGLPDPAPAAAGYFQGRFSNGLNFADDMSLLLFGAPATPYLLGGINLGVGGAEAAFQPGEISPSFLPQLSLFQGLGQPIGSNDLVLVTFGGNDVRAVLTDLGPVDFTPTLTAFADGLTALLGAGAKHIVVTGIADIGALPSTRAFGNPLIEATATARTVALNSAIEALTISLSQFSGEKVEFYDLFAQEQALRANPAAYGLTNLTDTCQSGGPAAVLGGCVGYLYFDGIHPTTQVHALISEGILDQLAVPEPATWLLMVAGFGLAGASMRRRSTTMRFALAPAMAQ